MEIVPPDSPVLLEVTPRGYHGPSFVSSSNAAGNLPTFVYTSHDLLLIPFIVLLNSKPQALTSHLVSQVLLSHLPIAGASSSGPSIRQGHGQGHGRGAHVIAGLRAELSPSFCSMGLDGLFLSSSSLGSGLGC